MTRIQFYPDETLEARLISEAELNGVSISQLVIDVLNEYYNLNKSGQKTVTQLTKEILEEVALYTKDKPSGSKFDLLTASTLYRDIPVTYSGKPSTVRASIGRSFAASIGKGRFVNVKKAVGWNGRQELSVNNALVYEII